MKHQRNIRGKRSRRGVASAIGAILFLAMSVMLIGFMQEVYQTGANVNQSDLEKSQEVVSITTAYLDEYGRLVLNVTNRGSVTAHLVRLWIINQTDNDYRDFTFSNLYIEPGASGWNVTSVTLTSGKTYTIQVVTERGNIASYNLVPALRARISIIADSTVFVDRTMTVVLCITNNDTSNNNIYNLRPVLGYSLAPPPMGDLELIEGPTPLSIKLLPAGSTAYFRYVYDVKTTREITFLGSFEGAPSDNYELCTVQPTLYNYTISDEDLFKLLQISPYVTPIFHLDVFGNTPGLIDSSTNIKTYFGITLANPTERDITVFSVAVVSTFDIFQGGAKMTGMSPTSGWSAVVRGVFWESQASSTNIIIPPHSSYNFTFNAEMKATGSNVEVPVVIEALTTEGKFVKYFTGCIGGSYPTINLYYTRNPALNKTDIQYTYLNVPSHTERQFNVTIYNSGDTLLQSRVKLMMLIPRNWAVNRDWLIASSQTGWNMTSLTVSNNTDLSTLITITSTSNTLAGGSSLVFKFKATPPAVSLTTLYQMVTTAYYPGYGMATTGIPSISAAVCSIVLQITP